MFYETWRDEDAHRAHDLTPHVARIRNALKELAVSVRKVVLRRLEPSAAA